MLSIKNFLTFFPYCPICQIVIVEVPKKKQIGCLSCSKFYGTRMIRNKSAIFSISLEKPTENAAEMIRYYYSIHNHQMNIILLKQGVAYEDIFCNTVSNNLAFELFKEPDKLYSFFHPFLNDPEKCKPKSNKMFFENFTSLNI